MTIRSLTDAKVRALPPLAELYRVPDAEAKGLGITVYPTGRKVWNWKGRTPDGVKTFTLGSHPAYSVEAAREFASSITLEKERGNDPVLSGSELPLEPAIVATKTVDWAFERYMAQEGGQKKSAGEKWRIYRKDIQPILGSKSIYKIRYDDLAKIVLAKSETAPIMSNRIVSLMKRFFRWCVTKGRVTTRLETDPSQHVVKLEKAREGDRFLCDYELSILISLLKASSSRLAEPSMFILFTACRRSEAFEARWSEFDFTKGTWTLPSERSKNGDELVLPLSSQALALLANRRRFAGNYEYVWPGRNGPERPLSGYSKSITGMRDLMNRIAARDRRTVASWSLHDLRRSVATGMTGLLDEGFRPKISTEVVERILNHKQVGIRRIYNRWEYFAEKKQALQLWADHLDSLVPPPS